MPVKKGGENDGNTDFVRLSSGGGLGGWVVNVGSTNNGYSSLNAVGGGSAHQNMPPYRTVYAWQRTA